MSPELKAFLQHFKANCSVAVINTIEDRTFFHWKRLCFDSLNCEEMMEIAQYIKKTFSNPGNYSHLLPEICVYNHELCLTIDVADIKKKLIK